MQFCEGRDLEAVLATFNILSRLVAGWFGLENERPLFKISEKQNKGKIYRLPEYWYNNLDYFDAIPLAKPDCQWPIKSGTV